MEAAHLGAALARQDDAMLTDAIGALSTAPKLPDLSQVLDDDGKVRDGLTGDLETAHAWLAAAVRVRAGLPEIAQSLAIPTWRYGHEPSMPFATGYAKFFQNSLREEALVQQARAGIVYARGGGGTIREIFEDLEENYYAKDPTVFTPMVFFDADGYWEKTAPSGEGIALDQTVKQIVRMAHSKKGSAEPYLEKLLFTTNYDEIVRCMEEHAPDARQIMMHMVA